MGSLLSKSDHDKDVNLNIKSVSTSEDMIFQSGWLSDAIKDNKTDVKKGIDKFSKNDGINMELLSRQATAVSRNDMKEILIKWKKDLKLDQSSDCNDLEKLYDVAECDYWPEYLSGPDSPDPWESKQQPTGMTNWLYFYVSRMDAQRFNIAICHLITREPNILRNVLIGGLCEKGFLLKDDDDNIYLNFPRSD